MIRLEFPGTRPQSKRNSKFAHGRTYVDPVYAAWRRDFGRAAQIQYRGEPIAEPIAVSITFGTASGLMRGDLDNSFAACADGLMDGGVLDDDKWIRRLSASVVKARRDQVGIVIEIERLTA